jgi:hypothetical protein
MVLLVFAIGIVLAEGVTVAISAWVTVAVAVALDIVFVALGKTSVYVLVAFLAFVSRVSVWPT